MKIALRILIIFLGISLSLKSSQAQDIKPIIDLATIDADNPLVAFHTCAIRVHVKLVSCDTDVDTGAASGYMGNLKYYLQTDKMGQHVPEIDPILIDNDIAEENMPVGGKLDTLWFNVDTALFRTSGVNPVNVIIIWPAFTSPIRPVCDSSEYLFWEVPGYMGIEDKNYQSYGSNVFPNPVAPMQMVYIDSKYSMEITEILIYNSLGQIMNSKEFDEGENSKGYVLPTDDLSPGIYHLHIRYRDKKTEVVKFIKN